MLYSWENVARVRAGSFFDPATTDDSDEWGYRLPVLSGLPERLPYTLGELVPVNAGKANIERALELDVWVRSDGSCRWLDALRCMYTLF